MKQIPWLFYLSVTLTVQWENPFYQNHTLEDPNLCSAAELKHGTIKLDKLTSGALLYNKRFKDRFRCSIRVKSATKTDGIIAVIQQLELRKNESSGECIDYVRFSVPHRPSEKFCGSIDSNAIMNRMVNRDDLWRQPLERNSYVSASGDSITVEVFIGKSDPFEKQLTINIAFTLYTACRPNLPAFMPCLPDDTNMCIKHSFFNDKIVNCPYVGCVDECSIFDNVDDECCKVEPIFDDTVDKMSLGSKVIISSMSSLVISFIVFVLCIFMCRKYKKLCWSDDFSNPQPAPDVQSPRVMEMSQQPSQSGEPPNARDLEKDLPPSYESLFPDR